MQWLINIVKDWCIAQGYLTLCLVDRGDPSEDDFLIGDFTKDDNWHVLDLSAIVPAGAKAAKLSLRIRADVSNAYAQFRKNGIVNAYNKTWLYTEVAGVYVAGDATCFLDPNAKIEYRFSNVTWTDLRITVKGWYPK